MDKNGAQDVAKDAAEKARSGVNEAVQRAGPYVQSTLDQGKSMAQDLTNRASEAGKQAMGRAGEYIEGITPRAKEVASNLYDQGSQSGEYLRQYVAQQPLTALLIAGAIGYTLAYLIHRP
jgi:ElaB/YqjD/DUF883 family membrane-anchored ribosome-binding protein